MVYQRAWNFDGAARLTTTIDFEQALVAGSDFHEALLAFFEGLVVTGNLPSGGATDQVLKKLSGDDGDANWGSITQDEIAGLVDELAGKATVADVAAVAVAVATKAEQAALNSLTTTVSGKASQASLDSLSTTVAGKASAAAVAALTFGDLADVSNAAAGDENAAVFNTGTGQWEPTDLSNRFAEADPSTGQTIPQAAAPATLFGFIIDEGSDPPAGLPLGLGLPIIGFERAVPPSLVPLLLDDNFSQAANNVVLTMPQLLVVGTKLTVAIGYSGEATVPDHFLIAFSGGGVGQYLYTVKNSPNTTTGIVQCEVEITTEVPNAATLTVTAKDVADVSINRVHLMAAAVIMPNTADDALDKQVNSPSIASSSTMTVITSGPTAADTIQASEVALGLAMWNSGAGGTTRVLGGTNGWQKLTEVKSDNGSTARSIALFYIVLTTTGRPSLTTQMVASDGATGQAAAQVATFLAATA